MIRNSRKVVTRFAPSPTGFFHIGSARTALFNFLVAHKYGGEIVLRIEDTDKERSKKEFEEDIVQGLSWLGLSYNAFYRQSERGDVYARYIRDLLEKDLAYVSEEEKDGKKNTVIRFRNPKERVSFQDVVRGEITMDTEEMGDFVIARSFDDPLYHLAVVIDDKEMDVTHIVRGEDHISNTPRQILLQKAIGAPAVFYAHLPLVFAPDKSKLSKRHGTMPLLEYKKMGYLPAALLNFLVLLGWSPQSGRGDQGEIFTLDELVERFSLERIQKGGAVFNGEKLDWINKEHIKMMLQEEYTAFVEEYLPEEVKELPQYSKARLKALFPTLRDRIVKFGDLGNMWRGGELAYFFTSPDIDIDMLVWPKEKESNKTKQHLKYIVNILQFVSEDEFTSEKIKNILWDYATQEGRGAVLWPMRYALSGKDKSPDPFTLASIFGKDETLARLSAAERKL